MFDTSTIDLDDLADRFWTKVKIGAPDECWPWQAALGSDGYGKFGLSDRSIGPHRIAWMLVNGPQPCGTHLDHTCHSFDLTCLGGDNCPHRRCCNPRHLELVEPGVNTMRGRGLAPTFADRDTCENGHLFTAANTIPRRDGGRRCRTCRATYHGRTQARMVAEWPRFFDSAEGRSLGPVSAALATEH